MSKSDTSPAAPQPTAATEHFREADCDILPDPESRGGLNVGGQHVGVVSSAVMVRHRPTGFSATCREHRSQFRNKAAAMQELRELVDSLYERHPDDQ